MGVIKLNFVKFLTRIFLFQTLKTLTTSIDKLKAELGTRHVVIKQPDSSAPIKSPEQAKKEILDVELELMTKSTSGEDTAELKKKLADLTAIVSFYAFDMTFQYNYV